MRTQVRVSQHEILAIGASYTYIGKGCQVGKKYIILRPGVIPELILLNCPSMFESVNSQNATLNHVHRVRKGRISLG